MKHKWLVVTSCTWSIIAIITKRVITTFEHAYVRSDLFYDKLGPDEQKFFFRRSLQFFRRTTG